jgi:hypothetical protein
MMLVLLLALSVACIFLALLAIPNVRTFDVLRREIDKHADASEEWQRRALAAEARVAELTAGEEGHVRPTAVPGDARPVTTRHRIATRPAESGRARVWVLVLLVLTGCGASVSSGALKTAVVVIDGAATMRRYLCSRALDPLLGDPRAEPVTAPPPPVPPAPSVQADAAAPASMDGGL